MRRPLRLAGSGCVCCGLQGRCACVVLLSCAVGNAGLTASRTAQQAYIRLSFVVVVVVSMLIQNWIFMRIYFFVFNLGYYFNTKLFIKCLDYLFINLFSYLFFR